MVHAMSGATLVLPNHNPVPPPPIGQASDSPGWTGAWAVWGEVPPLGLAPWFASPPDWSPVCPATSFLRFALSTDVGCVADGRSGNFVLGSLVAPPPTGSATPYHVRSRLRDGPRWRPWAIYRPLTEETFRRTGIPAVALTQKAFAARLLKATRIALDLPLGHWVRTCFLVRLGQMVPVWVDSLKLWLEHTDWMPPHQLQELADLHDLLRQVPEGCALLEPYQDYLTELCAYTRMRSTPVGTASGLVGAGSQTRDQTVTEPRLPFWKQRKANKGTGEGK